MASSPEAKRKKSFTGHEILERLKLYENDVKRAVGEMIQEVSPFDINDDNINLFEDRLDRLEVVSQTLRNKVYRLKRDVKERRTRKHPELLDEKIFSCSQHSVLQSEYDSEELGDPSSSQDIEFSITSEKVTIDPPSMYKKKPLNQTMSQFSR